MSDYMDSLYENLNEESLAAITAGAGYNDGANNGFWRIQPRLPKFREGAGQWMEMGAEIRAAFKKLGQIMSRAGKVVGSGGTSDTVRVLHPAEPERGLPEEIKIYPTTAVELIGARLSPEYLRSIGRDPNATGTGISAMSNPDNLPNYEDLPTAPVTDDDRRLAELGLNSPEGQEMSKFKDSPEGQEVARLEPESADDVLDTPAEIARFMGGEAVQQRGGNPTGKSPYDGSGRIGPGEKLTLSPGYEPGTRSDLIPEEIEQNKAMMDGSYYDGTMSFEDKVRIERAIAKKNGKISIYDLSDEELMDMEKTGKLTGFAMRARGELARRGLIPEYRNLKTADGKDPDLGKRVPPIARDLDAEIAKAEADADNMAEGSASDAAFDLAYKKIDILKAERDRQKGKAPAEAAKPKLTEADVAGFRAVDQAIADIVVNSPGDEMGDNLNGDLAGPNERAAIAAIRDKFNEMENSDRPDSEVVPDFKEFLRRLPGLEEGMHDDLIAAVDRNYSENKLKAAGLSRHESSGVGDTNYANSDGEVVGNIKLEENDDFTATNLITGEKSEGHDSPREAQVALADMFLGENQNKDEDLSGVQAPEGDAALEALDYKKVNDDPEEWASNFMLKQGEDMPALGVYPQEDGTWELTDYLTGEIFPGKTREEAIDGYYERNRDLTPEEVAAEKAADEAAKVKAEADRLAANEPKMSKEQFVNDLMDRISSRAERTSEKPIFPSKEALDEAYKDYSDYHDKAVADREDLDYDYNMSLVDETTSELLDDAFPVAQMKRELEMDAAELFERGMNGEDVNLGDIMGRKKDIIDEGDEGDDEKSLDELDGPSDEDLEGIDAEDLGFDEDADWNDQRRSTERVSAYEVGPGDYVIDENGNVARVEDVFEDAAGNVQFTLVNFDGGPESSWTKGPDSSVSKVEFGGDSAKDDSGPFVPAPKISPDLETIEPELEPAPATARAGYDGSEIEVGDEMFTTNGANKLGNVSAVRKHPDGSNRWQVRLEQDGRVLRDWWDIDDRTVFNKPNGEKAPEPVTPEEVVPEVPEAPEAAEQDVNPEPEPVVLTEPEPEVPATPTPDSGALPVAPARPSKKPKVKKTSRVADPDDVVKPAPMETDDGTSDIEFNSPPPPGGPGGGGGPDDPNNPLNIRNAKVDVLRDENGNIIYEADEDGNPIYDDKGKKIPMLDTEAVKALVKKFFPNAKETADGLGITIWRQTIDGNTFDMSIKRTDRGDHIITVGVTDESGERKEYISVAPRKSWAAVWNLREDGGGNSPFAIYNLITGAAKIGSTGGKDYFKLPTALERFQYYRAQKSNWPGVSRFATVAELFEGIANGRKEKLNFSLPKKPGTSRRFTMEEWMSPENEANRLANETWLTVRASEVGSLKDAIETGLATGDWSGAYFLMLNMKGKFPQDIDSLASLRTMLNKYLKDALPNANHRRLAGVITTFSNLVRSGLKNPSKLETPYIGADGHTEIKEGMWVKYKNILGEWSIGKVVRRRPSDDIARPTQSPDQAGYQHHDQVVVEFANGETVDQITAEHLFPLDKKDKEYGKPTKYQGKPSKKRRQSEREALAGLASMFADIDDPSEESEPEAEKPSAGPTKVDDLTPGSMLYSKSGVPLGDVVEVTPITADNGKRGFAIAYVDANGDTKIVKVAAGELRGPKA